MSEVEQDLEAARAYATWTRLEREFTLGAGASGGRLLLPRHSRESFMGLLSWMARDEERRQLMPTVMRATGLFRSQTQLDDWGADEAVQAHVAKLSSRARRGLE